MVESHSFPYRFAFIFSFAIIVVAGKALESVKETKLNIRYITEAVIIFGATGLILYFRHSLLSNIGILIIYIIISVMVVGGACAATRRKISQHKIMLVLLTLTICELSYNAMLAFRDYSSSAKEFTDYVEAMQDILKETDEDANGAFYRFEKTKSYLSLTDPDRRIATCESALFGYNSIEFYTSAYDDAVDLFLMQMGYSDLTARQVCPTETYWSSPMLLLDSLLSTKYMVMDKGGYGLEKVGNAAPSGDIFENIYALPLGYNVSERALEQENYRRNPFENQELFLNKLLGENTNVYLAPKIERKSSENSERETYVLTAKTDGSMYIYIDGADVHGSYEMKNCELYVDNKKIQNTCSRFTTNGIYLGDYKIGETIKIELKRLSELYGLHNIYATQLETKNFEKTIQKLRTGYRSELNVFKNKISGKYTTERESMVLISVPYEKNWKAFIDGKRVEVEKISDIFVGVRVPEGTHEIKMVYKVPALYIGMMLSIFGCVIFGIWTVCEKRTSKKKL